MYKNTRHVIAANVIAALDVFSQTENKKHSPYFIEREKKNPFYWIYSIEKQQLEPQILE